MEAFDYKSYIDIQECHLRTFNVATIFFRGHPYIWHTTICHDNGYYIFKSYNGSFVSSQDSLQDI